MFTTASDLRNSAVFCVLAILATVLAISLSPALAHTMCTFFVVCHLNTLLSLVCLNVGLAIPMVKQLDLRSWRGAHYDRPLLLAQSDRHRFVQLNGMGLTVNADHEVGRRSHQCG